MSPNSWRIKMQMAEREGCHGRYSKTPKWIGLIKRLTGLMLKDTVLLSPSEI